MENLDAVRRQVVAGTDPSRERLLLHRLDMTYVLLNERMDRELQWLCRRIDGPDGEKVALEHLSQAGPNVCVVSPSGLRGVGIYDGESNGAETWRWFGRTVTLFFTEVDPKARCIRFMFATSSPTLDVGKMSAVANGYEAPYEWSYPEGRIDLTIALTSLGARSDRTLILALDFATGWSPANDARVLTFACIGVEIEP